MNCFEGEVWTKDFELGEDVWATFPEGVYVERTRNGIVPWRVVYEKPKTGTVRVTVDARPSLTQDEERTLRRLAGRREPLALLTLQRARRNPLVRLHGLVERIEHDVVEMDAANGAHDASGHRRTGGVLGPELEEVLTPVVITHADHELDAGVKDRLQELT